MYKSMVLTSNGAVKAGPGALYALILAPGSDAAACIAYDNTAGSGTKLAKLVGISNLGMTFSFPPGIVFSNLYITMSGTSPMVTVVYR